MLTSVPLLGACTAVPQNCTGNSTDLPKAHCDAWGDLYASTNGDKWTGLAAACTQTNPCACFGSYGPASHPYVFPVCSATGTTVVQM